MSFLLNSHYNYSSKTFEGILPSFANYTPKEDPIFNENYYNFEIYNYCIIESSCPICLNNIKKNITLNKCGHSFCSKCINKWFKYSQSCPICRRNI